MEIVDIWVWYLECCRSELTHKITITDEEIQHGYFKIHIIPQTSGPAMEKYILVDKLHFIFVKKT